MWLYSENKKAQGNLNFFQKRIFTRILILLFPSSIKANKNGTWVM